MTRGARAIGRRFRLALVWIATGILLGILLPALGLAVIAAFIPYYWLPIHGEIARMKRQRAKDHRA
jgi:TMEM175 potassium channel family protein